MKKRQTTNEDVQAWDQPAVADPPTGGYPNGYLVSLSQPSPGLSVDHFLRQGRGQARFYWEDGRDPVIFAGVGTAAELFAWGENRYATIQAQAQALFKNAVVSNAEEPLASPRLFGGFAFRDDFAPDNTWAVFHPAHFILPHYQLLQHGDTAWLTINAQVPDDEDLEALLDELRVALSEKYAYLCRQAVGAASAPQPPAALTYPMSYADWEEMITTATTTIKNGPMDKVVLSRVVEIKFDGAVDIDAARHYLNQTYPDCYRFLFEPRPGHAFYGATPELLVKVVGTQLTTMGLAGSAPRGQTAVEDQQYAQALMDSAKDRYEHDLVVQSVRRRLTPLAETLTIPDKPDIYTLSNIHHLYTPIHGRLKAADGVLPLVETLHPTPALGGTPRDLAMQFIQAAEPVPRGWYAAPIGWLDDKLDGVFGVAIRSAVCQENRVWAYAGAGIVADSVPEKEWAETALKFRPMLSALGIEQTQQLQATPTPS